MKWEQQNQRAELQSFGVEVHCFRGLACLIVQKPPDVRSSHSLLLAALRTQDHCRQLWLPMFILQEGHRLPQVSGMRFSFFCEGRVRV